MAAKALIIPDLSPKWLRCIPRTCEPPDSSNRIMDPNDPDDYARPHQPAWMDAFSLPPSSDPPRKRRSSDDLLSDPAFDVSVDFNSQEGFYEMAKKKKGGAAKQSLPPPPPPVPPPPPADEGNKDGGAGGDSNGGDAAGGAGGGGDDGGNGADAGWGDFATAKPKKKKGKDELDVGLPSIPTADFSADAFDEIKLGDDLGGKLDLGLGPPDGKGFGSWGTKWNSGAGGGGGDAGGGAGGGSGWDWSGAGGNDPMTATADAKIEESSWGINRGKPKKVGKSSLSFGEFGDVEEHTEVAKPDEKEDPWGFGAKKDTKKKKDPSIWGSDPLEEKKDPIGESDPWGWGTSKKKPPPEPVPAKKETEDIWDTWGISKKDRAKKKGIMDDVSEPPMPAPDPPPSDDLWGGDGWSKKDKKKSSIWGESDVPVPAPDPPTQNNDKNENDDFWNAFGNKKKSPVPSVQPPPEEKAADGWSAWGLAKKVGKKSTSIFPEFGDDKAEEAPKPGDDGWDLWGTGKKKKNDLISLDEVPPPAPEPVESSGGEGGGFFSSWGLGRKKKAPEPAPWKPTVIEEPSDEFWNSVGKKKADPLQFLQDNNGEIMNPNYVGGCMDGKVAKYDSLYWNYPSNTRPNTQNGALTGLPPLSPTTLGVDIANQTNKQPTHSPK